jgi:hypothetical protein
LSSISDYLPLRINILKKCNPLLTNNVSTKYEKHFSDLPPLACIFGVEPSEILEKFEMALKG